MNPLTFFLEKPVPLTWRRYACWRWHRWRATTHHQDLQLVTALAMDAWPWELAFLEAEADRHLEARNRHMHQCERLNPDGNTWGHLS